jgi:exodeoxyribonuclease V alpha subunit
VQSDVGIQFAIRNSGRFPSSVEGIRAFLGSGLIAGIGKEYAGRIVGQFSEKTLEIIDREPERLLEVEGIGPKRFERIVSRWKEHRDVADIMQLLQSYGISSTGRPCFTDLRVRMRGGLTGNPYGWP